MDSNRERIIEKYAELGYTRHSLTSDITGCVLLHPGFERQVGELNETLPIAEFYAKLGHLIVLTAPRLLASGIHIKSPDGFLDEEKNLIEFKHCTSGTAANIYNNLSDASKNVSSVIRSLLIANQAEPSVIVHQIFRKYLVSKRMDKVHIIFRNKLYYFDRLLFESEGYVGLQRIFS